MNANPHRMACNLEVPCHDELGRFTSCGVGAAFAKHMTGDYNAYDKGGDSYAHDLATEIGFAGKPKLVPHASAVYTRENAGSASVGWMHFQPLWQEICRTDPELFD